MSIPQQHECDPTKPDEAFTWALVGLPGPKHAPMIVHPMVLRQWSQHLWDLGFRHDPEQQTKEYHPPVRGHHHWLNGSGQWMPKGTPRPARITAPDVTVLTPHERAELVQQLHHHGDLDHLVRRKEIETAAEGASVEPEQTPDEASPR
ncbi:DUF2744 domain-containing protein [Nocardia sp. CDC153]|uniref:phage gene 29 protein family protein n=1 Tax=Nocardia sp. CDC153 TaxID=3112167 RepID=UPI002DB782B4|nr:DUF2744 domain-containing protein [Nocardia sp. CDC153]MEC3955803.1 DUF2744 domain-containing protein [Nocardia sp. CDC153]